MSRISKYQNVAWENYHLTIGDQINPATLAPYLVIEKGASIWGTDDPSATAIARLAATALEIQDYLAESLQLMESEIGVTGAPYAFGTTGKSWSFADLVGTPKWQFDAAGLTGCSPAKVADLHANCLISDRFIAFVSGGTRLREIAEWAKERNLMIGNSGTHLGPTIAGGAGTASHGSRLGRGGIQDMVLGMHIVTGPDSSVWIERSDQPILSDAAVTALGADPIRNTSMFEDALIHLGGMGIVNAVAIELDENRKFYEARAEAPLDQDWATRIAQGRYGEISDAIMVTYAPSLVGKEPRFYELTIDPFNYKGPTALHILYYDAPADAPPAAKRKAKLTPADAVVGFFQQFLDQPILTALFQPMLRNDTPAGNEWPDEIPLNAYLYYRKEGKFAPSKGANEPFEALDWSELHTDVITTGQPGVLYNASFAVKRELLPQALDAITQAVTQAQLPPMFVFTARFVATPAGSLAFTRFKENAVIEIDGASPWFIKAMAAKYPDFAPIADQIAYVLRDGALLVRAALEAAGIDYSMHWAKLGELNSDKVESDFGPSADPNSALSHWRDTRTKLLSPRMQAVFWNKALVSYGLVTQPTSLPPKSPATL